MLKRAISVGVSIVIAVAAYFIFVKIEQDKAPDVGACVSITEELSTGEFDETDCDSDDANYVVTADDGKCDETELTYVAEVRNTDAVELCMDINVAEGECIEIADEANPDLKVSCDDFKTDPNVIKVVKVDDTTAEATCPKPKKDFPVPNVTRGTTICVRGLA